MALGNEVVLYHAKRGIERANLLIASFFKDVHNPTVFRVYMRTFNLFTPRAHV